MTNQCDILSDAKKMEALLKNVPKHWDGKKAILEMKNNGNQHWRQMEWIGFYFQYLCEKFFAGVMKFQEPRYGKTSFDGLMSCAWDFKAHPSNNENKSVICNDSEAVERAIKEYGCTGLLLAIGSVTMDDEKRSFQKWHEELKGGKSEYEKERIKRGATSRKRKTTFDLEEILFIRIDKDILRLCDSFQKNFRNSDGSPRREKVLIKLGRLTMEIIKHIEC